MPTNIAPPITPARSNGSGQAPGDKPIEVGFKRSRRDGLLLVIAALAALAVLTSMVAVGFGLRAVDEAKNGTSVAPATQDRSPAANAEVTLAEMAIKPGALEVASGGTLAVTNGGSIAHNLSVEGTSLRTAMLDPGSKARLDVSGLAAGAYTLYCEVPGHREAGMQATFTVVEGAAGMDMKPGAQPAQDTGEPAMSADEMDELMSRATKAFPAATEGKGAQLLAPKLLAEGTKQFELTT